MSGARRAMFLAALVVLIALAALGAWSYFTLPAVIPTRFDGNGDVSAWGPKWTILILPATAALAFALLFALGRTPARLNLPQEMDPERGARASELAVELVAALALISMLGMTALETETIAAARSGTMGPILATAAIVLFCTLGCIGVYAVRIYRDV